MAASVSGGGGGGVWEGMSPGEMFHLEDVTGTMKKSPRKDQVNKILLLYRVSIQEKKPR